MKLSKTVFGLLATSAHGKWKDCVTIDTNAIANVSPDGLDCSGDTCALRCADGFTPKAPKKVKCIQEDSTWSWNKDLGTCVTCKDITGIEDEKLDVACKVNSKNQRVCNLTCPAGTFFNGKEGKTGTKLICKCNKKGVCKWKNTNNKKINGATYRGYSCQGSSDSNDDGDSGTGDSGTGDAGTGDNGTNGTGTGPATGTNDPTAPVPARCRDPNSSTGVLEHADGTGGCPPRLVNWSIANFEQLNNIGFDPNQLMGTHLDGRSYIGVGVAGESEASPIAQAIVSRFDICSDMSKYGSEAESRSVELKMPKNGQAAKCEKNLVWTWQSSYVGKHDKFAGVTISPDKKFIIASGVRGSKTKFKRWLVKLDAETGKQIWEITMPNENISGEKHGYESVEFTSDGGFIAGGFVKRFGNMPGFKSGGGVDDGTPIFQKFSAEVAQATTDFETAPTPTWTFICGKANYGSVNCDRHQGSSIPSMQVFNDNGVEKVVSILAGSSIIVVDVATGSELGYNKIENGGFTDVEVDFDADGNVTGYVAGGLTSELDTNTLGCAEAAAAAGVTGRHGGHKEEEDCEEDCGPPLCYGWQGMVMKISPDLNSKPVWRTTFGDMNGGVGMFAPGGVPLSAMGHVMVYTECWSIAAIPTGYVLACGQGLEGCDHFSETPVDQSLVEQCKTDPRLAWRGVAVAVDFDGNIDWYRADNWGPNPKAVEQCIAEEGPNAGCGDAGTSAYEWVSYDPSDPTTLVFFSDEGMGYGFSTIDLTTRDFDKQ